VARQPPARVALLPLLLGLLACGASKAAPAPPRTPPRWEQPVELSDSTYQGGISLSGDGRGGVAVAWLREGAGSTTEVVAARMRPDGSW
jgi:hypothetical protein